MGRVLKHLGLLEEVVQEGDKAQTREDTENEDKERSEGAHELRDMEEQARPYWKREDLEEKRIFAVVPVESYAECIGNEQS